MLVVTWHLSSVSDYFVYLMHMRLKKIHHIGSYR